MLRHYSLSLSWLTQPVYYGFIAVGIVLGAFLTQRRLVAVGLHAVEARRLVLVCALSAYPVGIVSSHAVAMFYTPRETWSWTSWLQHAVAGGTHTYHAAIALPALVWSVYMVWRKLHLATAWDTILLYFPLGHAFGRAGCFGAGCCFGRPVHWEIGPLHYDYDNPVPLYELAGNLLLFGLLRGLHDRIYASPAPRAARGAVAGAYLLGYGAMRFALEEIRTEPVVVFGLTQAQLVMCTFVVAGTALLVRAVGRRRSRVDASAHA